jgi:hypothetical protein
MIIAAHTPMIAKVRTACFLLSTIPIVIAAQKNSATPESLVNSNNPHTIPDTIQIILFNGNLQHNNVNHVANARSVEKKIVSETDMDAIA